MKNILLAVAMLATFGANADDFCRVVTFDSWTTVDIKGVHKENLKENTNTEIFNYENGHLYYVMVDVQNPTKIDLFTYVGKWIMPIVSPLKTALILIHLFFILMMKSLLNKMWCHLMNN